MARGWPCRRDALYSLCQLQVAGKNFEMLTNRPCSSGRKERINGGVFIMAGLVVWPTDKLEAQSGGCNTIAPLANRFFGANTLSIREQPRDPQRQRILSRGRSDIKPRISQTYRKVEALGLVELWFGINPGISMPLGATWLSICSTPMFYSIPSISGRCCVPIREW